MRPILILSLNVNRWAIRLSQLSPFLRIVALQIIFIINRNLSVEFTLEKTFGFFQNLVLIDYTDLQLPIFSLIRHLIDLFDHLTYERSHLLRNSTHVRAF